MSQGGNLSGRRLAPALARRKVRGEGSWEAACLQGLSPGERAHPGRPRIKGRPLLPRWPRLCHSVRGLVGCRPHPQLPCLSLGPPVSRVWGKAKCPTSQRRLSNRSLRGGPRAWKGRGEQSAQQSSTRISYQPRAGKTPGQNEQKVPQAHSTENGQAAWGVEGAGEGPAHLRKPPGLTFPSRPQPGGGSGPTGTALPCSLGIAVG